MSFSDHVLAAMVDAVIVVDARTTISTVNAATERLLGLPAAELVDRPLRTLFDDQDALERTTQLQATSAGCELRKEEVAIRAGDGSLIPVSITGSPILDADGDFDGLVFVARDLRETHRLLSELERAKASVQERLEETRTQLIQAERLSVLGTLAAGVGHELRNINQLYTACLEQLAATTGAPDPALRDDLEWIGKHLESYATHLLDLARPARSADEQLALGEVADSVLKMLRLSGKTKYVSVESRFDERCRPVWINRTRLEQVLLNLIKNAVDAVEHPEAGGKEIRISVFDEGEEVICEIADTGCGIDAGDLSQIFEAFYTTKSPKAGTGLGLPVVKQILDDAGGQLSVDSEPGAGTTVRVILPAG